MSKPQTIDQDPDADVAHWYTAEDKRRYLVFYFNGNYRYTDDNGVSHQITDIDKIDPPYLHPLPQSVIVQPNGNAAQPANNIPIGEVPHYYFDGTYYWVANLPQTDASGNTKFYYVDNSGQHEATVTELPKDAKVAAVVNGGTSTVPNAQVGLPVAGSYRYGAVTKEDLEWNRLVLQGATPAEREEIRQNEIKRAFALAIGELYVNIGLFFFPLLEPDGEMYTSDPPTSGELPEPNEANTSTSTEEHPETNTEPLAPTTSNYPQDHSGAKGLSSGRDFDPDMAGGPIRSLSYTGVKITSEGVDVVEAHIQRFGGGGPNELAMVGRLRQIVAGEIEATDWDLRFYTHELREYVRYRTLGYPTGEPLDPDEAHDLWNNAHTATMEDYGLKTQQPDGSQSFYHPDIYVEE